MNTHLLNVAYRPLRAVFFDLDGTLIDSAPDITAAVNELMTAYGLDPHTLPAVRGMIGGGMGKLVERAFAAHGVVLSIQSFRERRARMVDIYARNLTRLTTVRPGALRAVSAARAAGLKTGVVTNKPEGFSRIILSHFGFLKELDLVVGGDSGYPKKPAPEMLYAACDIGHCNVNEAILVGDSTADVMAAKAAGMPCVLVKGGYSNVPIEELEADQIVDSLECIGTIFAGSERKAS